MNDIPGDWSVFLRTGDAGPMGISVRLDAEQAYDTDRMPHLVVLHVAAVEHRENGLPSREDFEVAYSVEDALAASDDAALTFVARVAARRGYDMCCYSADVDRAERVLRAIAASAAAGRRSNVRSLKDDGWQMYRALLPTPEEQQEIGDWQVLTKLRELGDDGSAERPIRHWLYFPGKEEMERAWRTLQADDFTLAYQSTDDDDDDRWCLCIDRDDRPAAIGPTTLMLHRLATDLGGEYDGWESEVRGGTSSESLS